MELLTEVFTERVLFRNAIATGILIVAILLARRAALGLVRRADWASDRIQLRCFDGWPDSKYQAN